MHVSRSEKGFTLVELLIVMTLLCLALGLAAVSFADRLPSARLHAAGRDMVSMLRQARTLAEIKGEEHSVVIDFNEKTFGIRGYGVRRMPEGMSIEVQDATLGRIVKGRYRIAFYPAGDHESATVVLKLGARSITITTDPVQGPIAIRG